MRETVDSIRRSTRGTRVHIQSHEIFRGRRTIRVATRHTRQSRTNRKFMHAGRAVLHVEYCHRLIISAGGEIISNARFAILLVLKLRGGTLNLTFPEGNTFGNSTLRTTKELAKGERKEEESRNC